MKQYLFRLLLYVSGCMPVILLATEKSYVMPQRIAEVSQSKILLNGTWQLKLPSECKWVPIQVPGEVVMQGYSIEHDVPFRYRKSFILPDNYKDKTIILRFDGVYSHARLKVNGREIREHFGGFTRWETDITSYVKAGRKNEIELEVTDRLDDISYASGYAHHPIGGILRDVTVFALPQTYVYDFHAETILDSSYRDATLKLTYFTASDEDSEIRYTLVSPAGEAVKLPTMMFKIQKGNRENVNELPLDNPLKWDAEHPHLYTLKVDICRNGKEISHFIKKIGFRKVEIDKERMLVNGRPVKLRGACRHDVHPTLGRTTTPALDSLDVVLFKRANMNFVRTSHYPPTEKFLEYCDELGIYVECETAVCFVDTYRQKNYKPGRSQDDPNFTHRYLSQCREMVQAFRSHPSILFWSIGNESRYGENFRKSWEWVKSTDTTRPVIFSWPGTVKGDKIYDILSMHYPGVGGNMTQFGVAVKGFEGGDIPTLFDEWAHPACYTYETLQEDPNIREFWGISLDMMWSKLFGMSGGLGGAVWCYSDETFMVPKLKVGTPYWKTFARTAKPENFQGDCVGYGEWGIVDVWRREKPEFWSTKKAYSPVRLLTTQISDFVSGERLVLPVYNRFDHTNLNEIRVCYTHNQGTVKTVGIELPPHEKGNLLLPGEDWKAGDRILVEFYTSDNHLIDAEQVTLGEEKIVFPSNAYKEKLQIVESDKTITVKGEDFAIPFSRETGLICNAVSKGRVIMESGPFLNMNTNLNHLSGAEVRKSAKKFILSEKDWRKKSFLCELRNGRAEILLTGKYQEVEMDIQLLVCPEGRIDISYVVSGEPNGYIREAGLSFLLPESYEKLAWKRKGHWSYYPDNAFSGNAGVTPLYNRHYVAYGENPNQPWQMDTHNYYYWADAGANCLRPLVQTAKGLKENIYYYTLSVEKGKGLQALSVISPDASLACRVSKRSDEQLVLYVMNGWDYPEIAWGNYCKKLEASPCSGRVTLILQ